jgi:hypothetical protein
VFPILVGTALSSNDLDLDPTYYNPPIPIPIPGFTTDEADTLVKNHFKNSAQLLEDNRFRRLLAMVGGVGRPLERLKLILDEYQQPVSNWQAVKDLLDAQLRQLYADGNSWRGYLGALVLLLQGHPIMLGTTFPSLGGERKHVEDMGEFLKKGLVNSHSLEPSSLRAFSPHTYYLLPTSSHFLLSAPLCYLSLLPAQVSKIVAHASQQEQRWIHSIMQKILSSFDLFSLSFSVFEDLSVWQFFLRYLVCSWRAANQKENHVQGSQILFGTTPQSDTSPPVFQRRFALASSSGVFDLSPYHREFKFKPTGPDPFYIAQKENQPIDLSDPTIPFVALRLGGKSTFDGVLMVRDADQQDGLSSELTQRSQVDQRVGQDKTDALIEKSKRVKVEGNDVHYIVAVTNSGFRPNSKYGITTLAEMDNLFLVDKSVLDLYFSPSLGLALKYCI